MMYQEKEATEQSDAVRKEFEAQCDSQLLQEKITRARSTNNFNTVSTPVNTASASMTFSPVGPSFIPFGGSFPIDFANLPHDPLIHELEDTVKIQSIGIFGNAYDDQDLETLNTPYADQSVGAEADFNNMEPSTIVSPIPTTIVHSIHPKAQITGDPKAAIQTRGMTKKNSGEHPDWLHKDINKKKALIMMSFFAPVARVEEIRGYVCQPPGFVDPKFLEKVYKVEKALYGLHQAPRAWYETLSTYLMDNGFHRGQIDKTLFIKRLKGDILLVQVYVDDIIFGSTKKSLCDEFEQIMHNSIRSASTPMETHKALTKDEDGEDVDVPLYRFQVPPKVSHLNAVKRIFRYLKGQPKLGLWYPKDSPLILEAFSDSDYAGASLDMKSTIRAEYIAASHYCGQVLWIENHMLDYGFNFMQEKIHVDNESAIYVVKNPVYHSKTKNIETQHHFIRDSYEKRLTEMVKLHTDYNVADLLNKAFDVT
ncbi:putative ribonuclease H-like domain-containing protein, partial [Tanacetum coccineum]